MILGSKRNACEENKRGHSNSFHLYKYVNKNTELSYVIFFIVTVNRCRLLVGRYRTLIFIDIFLLIRQLIAFKEVKP